MIPLILENTKKNHKFKIIQNSTIQRFLPLTFFQVCFFKKPRNIHACKCIQTYTFFLINMIILDNNIP